jgi:guanylate kinase
MSRGVFAVIIGPTGVGKSTAMELAMKQLPEAGQTLSTTCRAPRVNDKVQELDGVHFNFLSCDEFQRRTKEDHFLEYAPYNQHWYGTGWQALDQALDRYPLVVKIVEIQGARIIKAKMPEAQLIFIKPGDFGDLEPRLRRRDPPMREEDIRERLEIAKVEIARCGDCDHVVTNWEGRLHECVRDVLAILTPFARRP